MNMADDADAGDRAARRAAAPGGRSARASRGAPSCSRARSARCSSSAASSAGRRRARRSRAFADAFGVPFFLNGMARGALPPEHPRLCARSRRFALAQADVVFVLRHAVRLSRRLRPRRRRGPRRQGRAGRSRRRRARAQPRVDVAIHGDSGLVLEQLLARGRRRKQARRVARRGARRRRQAAREDARRWSRTTSPPNPLRVCAELGKRLGPNDIVIGDGGDFVATAAYVLKLEWPQLWIDPGPARHARRRARLRDGGQARAPRRATSCSSTATAASACTRSSSRRWCVRSIPVVARHRQRRRLDADSPRPGRDLRRGARGGDRRSTTRATTKVVEALGGFGAWVDTSRSSAPRSTRRSPCGRAGVRQREARRQRFPQGRDQRLAWTAHRLRALSRESEAGASLFHRSDWTTLQHAHRDFANTTRLFRTSRIVRRSPSDMSTSQRPNAK